MNKSKIKDPRQWDKWRAAGAVEGMGAAVARAALADVTSVEELADLSALNTSRPMPAVEVKAGWSMDGAELADALEEDAPTPFGRPSEVAAAITAEGDARIAATVVVSPTVPESVTVPEAVARHNLEG